MGKFSKVMNAAKTVSSIRNAEDKGAAVGNLAAGAAMVAHPIIGTMAAPLIRKGVGAAVNKGLEVAHDPNVQARIQGGVRDLGSNLSGRFSHFQDAFTTGGDSGIPRSNMPGYTPPPSFGATNG